MFFGILTLITALSIAGVAAWFSIAGLMAIFSASAIAIAIMAGVLEVGKLVTASWLYRHWQETRFMMKVYMTSAVVVLMLITSMGIFGFLSKAHLDQAAEGGNNNLLIKRIEQQMVREQRAITDADIVIGQLDQAVQTLMDYDRIRGKDGAIAVRKSQAEERADLKEIITRASGNIATLQDDLLPLKEKELQVELKVGPLKYVAELVYGESSEELLDKAVRLFILLLIFVFDPLAIMMIIAANQTLLHHGVSLEKRYTSSDEEDEPPKKKSSEPVNEKQNEKRADKPSATTTVLDESSKRERERLEQYINRLESDKADLESEKEYLKNRPKEIEYIVKEKPISRVVTIEDTERVDALTKQVEELTKQLAQQPKPTQKQKEADLKNKMGFWAVPLPGKDKDI